MLLQKLWIKTCLGHFPDTVMVSLDLLGPLRLAGSDQVCGTELMDFGVTTAADLAARLATCRSIG